MADPPVLLLDLGGVLFDFDHDARLAALSACLGLRAAEVDALFWSSGFSDDCDAGRYADAAAVRAEIRHRTGYAGRDDDLDVAWCSAFTPDPRVLELVREQATGVTRVLFTNNGPLEEEALTRLHPEVFAPFDTLLFCHRLVANKPDPAVYRQVAELLGAPAGHLHFLDDDGQDNVEAARSCGWSATHYTSPDDVAALLRDLAGGS